MVQCLPGPAAVCRWRSVGAKPRRYVYVLQYQFEGRGGGAIYRAGWAAALDILGQHARAFAYLWPMLRDKYRRTMYMYSYRACIQVLAPDHVCGAKDGNPTPRESAPSDPLRLIDTLRPALFAPRACAEKSLFGARVFLRSIGLTHFVLLLLLCELFPPGASLEAMAYCAHSIILRSPGLEARCCCVNWVCRARSDDCVTIFAPPVRQYLYTRP